MIDLDKHVNWNSSEWTVIRMWLEEQDANKMSMLLGAKTHDEILELRGAVKFIRQLLAVEKAAKSAARQGL